MKSRIFWIIQLFIYCGLFVPTHGITADRILCDKFSIIAKINDRTLTYSLETDLPDSANVVVTISRSYSRKDVRNINSKDYYNSKKTVGQLRYINIVKIDDNQWCQTLAKQQKLMSRMSNPFAVDKVNDDVSISITFHVNQEDPIFEKQNQNVSGKMIDEKNPVRSIRVEKKIRLPLAIKYDPANIPQEIEVAIPKQVPDSEPLPAAIKPSQSKYVFPDKYNENQRSVTSGGSTACLSKSLIEDMVKFAAAGDKESFASYIQTKKCIVLKDGIEVTVMEYPGMFGGYTKFAYHGAILWTTDNGIKF